jgi:5-methylcytosine-specific restriction protein A
MPSRRSAPLPRDWPRIRRRILARDHGICHVCGRTCANEVDHVIPAIDGGSDDDSNLAAIHARPCHVKKTAAEANRHNAMATPRKRPEEKHPGDLT